MVLSGSIRQRPVCRKLKLAVDRIRRASVFLYARDYLRANDIAQRASSTSSGLFGLLGMMIMMSAHSMLTMYLGLETLALSQYALVAFDRNNRRIRPNRR